MQNTATETSLSMKDFTKYFDEHRLGKLYFPNGVGHIDSGHGYFLSSRYIKTDFYIELTELYKIITGWRIKSISLPIDDIVAVIAFGSAVRYPGVKKVTQRRKKYIFFGPEEELVSDVSIQPNDADFLVITGEDMVREEILAPVTFEWGDLYDSYTAVLKGGIHLVNRGMKQVVNATQQKNDNSVQIDTVSISALQEGIPIFFNGRLDNLVSEAGVPKVTPRKIVWDEDNQGLLVGRIV